MDEEKLLLAIEKMMEKMMDSKLEPIKQSLSAMQADISELKADMVEVKADISELKADMVEVKADISELKGRVLKLELVMENQVLPRIQLLFEGHESIANRLDHLEELPEKVDDIQTTVSVLKYVFKEHTHK